MHFALARYNPDGTLDPSFGTGGKVTTGFAGGFAGARALALQPDGKLVAVGMVETAMTRAFALARYNPDGTLDPTFGIGGKVTSDLPGSKAEAAAVVLQADGKLVAAGNTVTGDTSDFDFALARYNPNGTLDLTFGTTGKVTTDIAGGSFDRAAALALQPDGKLVAAGNTVTGANSDFALARYDTNGALDTTYGAAGKVTTDIAGRSNLASALAVQPDGKLVAAGSALADNLDFALARYNSNGTLDTTFGTGGTVTTDIADGPDRAAALILQPDGKLVAAGDAETGGSTDAPVRYFALARYNPNGTPDPAFGTDGKVTTDIAEGFAEAEALVLQPDGKLVAAGDALVLAGAGGNTDFALARYDSGPVS
jgi:uncharacterized delta-60 repeat protein